MKHSYVISRLDANAAVFNALLAGVSQDEYTWKPSPEKWSLLEIVCHLYDEEQEDFRARLKYILDNANHPMPSIDPQGWVTSRRYAERNFSDALTSFLRERKASVEWLKSLTNPLWQNAYQHPTLGTMTAEMFLVNWLAHDYLHFRQITRMKYQFLQQMTTESLFYAGTW